MARNYLTIVLCLGLGALSGYWVADDNRKRELQLTTIYKPAPELDRPDPRMSPTIESESYYSAAYRASLEDLQQLIAHAQTLESARSKRTALTAAFSALTERNPEFAAQRALALPSIHRRVALGAVFESWPQDQQDKAIKVISQMHRALDQNAAADAFIASSPNHAQLAPLLKQELGFNFYPYKYYEQQLAAAVQQDVFAVLSQIDQYSYTTVRAIGETIAEQLLAQGPERALAAIASLPRREQQSIAGYFVYVWTEKDPEQALTVLKEEANFADQYQYLSQAIIQIAQSDLDRAQALAEGISGQAYYDAWLGIAEIWVKQDLTSARAWFDNLHDIRLRERVAQIIFQATFEQDPNAAIAMATQPGATGFAQTLRTLASQIAKRDPEQALTLLQETDQLKLKQQILISLGSTDPRLATDNLHLLPESDDQINVVTNLAISYARHDPEAALQWATELDGYVSKLALRQIAGRYIKINPTRANEILDELDDDAASVWLQALAQERALKQPQEALEWLRSQRHRPGYAAALSSALSRWSQSEPESALSWITQNLSADQPSEVALSIVDSLANQNPQLAAKHLDRMANGQTKDEATERLLNHWVRSDRSSATAWAQALPGGHNRDNALRHLAFRSGGTERIGLLNGIDAEHLRFNAWSRVIARAATFNKSDAANMVTQARLADSKKVTLQKLLDAQ